MKIDITKLKRISSYIDDKIFIITKTKLIEAIQKEDKNFVLNTEPLLLHTLKIIDKTKLIVLNAISMIPIIKRELEYLIHHTNIINLTINKIRDRVNPIIKIISNILACIEGQQPSFLLS